MPQLAKILIFSGAALLVAGLIVYLFSRLGINFGQLPGDIKIQTSNMTCILALGTSILISIVLTLILNIAARLLNR